MKTILFLKQNPLVLSDREYFGSVRYIIIFVVVIMITVIVIIAVRATVLNMISLLITGVIHIYED